MADPVQRSFFYRISSGIFRGLLRLFCRFEAHGLEQVPRTGGCILVANHVSFLDPPVLGCAIRHRTLHFMARASLFRFPVLGSWLREVGVIPLRPEGGDVGALRTGVRVLRAGGALGLFPEGTRSPDGRLHAAKGGVGFLVAHGKVPVVPAYISGSYRAWPRGRRLPRPAKITVTYGPPIPYERIREWKTGDDAYHRIADHVMEAIARLGGVRIAPGPPLRSSDADRA